MGVAGGGGTGGAGRVSGSQRQPAAEFGGRKRQTCRRSQTLPPPTHVRARPTNQPPRRRATCGRRRAWRCLWSTAPCPPRRTAWRWARTSPSTRWAMAPRLPPPPLPHTTTPKRAALRVVLPASPPWHVVDAAPGTPPSCLRFTSAAALPPTLPLCPHPTHHLASAGGPRPLLCCRHLLGDAPLEPPLPHHALQLSVRGVGRAVRPWPSVAAVQRLRTAPRLCRCSSLPARPRPHPAALSPTCLPPPPPLPPLPPSSYFETEDWKGIPGQWWFGGGTDITPNYIVEEDLKHFHGVYKVGTGGRMQQCSITQRADG